ncbi:MAG: response regulator transcription factor [Leptolyngbyaceae cyanobacterium]
MERSQPLILIADDDRSLRKLLNLALARQGYDVVQVSGGQQALQDFERLRPDLVLLDAMMPDLNGFDCCQRLRQELQATVPILMITVLDDEASIQQAFAAGATDYIRKPINWSVLSERVKRLLANSQTFPLNAAETLVGADHAWESLLRQLLRQIHQQPVEQRLFTSLGEAFQRAFNAAQGWIFFQGHLYLIAAPADLPRLASQQSTLENVLNQITPHRTDIFSHVAEVVAELSSSSPEPIQAIADALQVPALLAKPIWTQTAPAGWVLITRHRASEWSKRDCDRIVDLSQLLALVLSQ